MSPNEIRRELDMPAVQHGDKLFIPCNVMELSKAINNGPTSDAVQNPVKEEPTDKEDEVKE